MLTVYHYPACSTCRKALAWLVARGVAHQKIDIVKEPPSRAILAQAALSMEVSPKKMFNTSGQSYRSGDFKAKLATMTDAQAFAALAADGKLIKRPLVIGDQVALIGFRETDWADRLG